MPKSVSTPVPGTDLINLASTMGDIGLSAALKSGSFDGIPIFGAITGLFRAGREISQQLFTLKVVKFLQAIDAGCTPEQRHDFVDRLKREGNFETFGETIMLILDRIDESEKPTIIGKIMSAHIRGQVTYKKAMRICSIVNRCYIEDLKTIITFEDGLQKDKTPIAETLFSAGVLSNGGLDGGDAMDGGGTIFVLNEYGIFIRDWGLS